MTQLAVSVEARSAELDAVELDTPAFVYDEAILQAEVAAAREVLAPTSARLLLAMKAFSFEHGLRVLGPWLDGFHSSSPFEARLARRVKPDGIVHTTAPGLRERDVVEVAEESDLLSFNSLTQWHRYRGLVAGRASAGLRVNPGVSFVADEAYDPCARNSKLGVPLDALAALLEDSPDALEGIEGILVHANAESAELWQLERIVERIVERLPKLLERLRWVNLGGGYLLQEACDPDALHRAVSLLRDGFGHQVLFEPGNGLVARAGSIVSTVVDVIEGGGRDIAVLDTTVNHLPEVLEYRYVPDLATEEGGCFSYILGGASCLVSDQFGVHCFDAPLEVGDRVVITGVGSYSLVKASWFNGIALPTIYSRSPDGAVTMRRRYSYSDFSRFHGGDDDEGHRA